MTTIFWDKFKWDALLQPKASKSAGATETQIRLGSISTFYPKITHLEALEVKATEKNPWLPGTPEYAAWVPIEPAKWRFPSGPFSLSYLSFLRWSNGGDFISRQGRLLRFRAIEGIRGWMIDLRSPENLPFVVPFASNEFYDIYCFDMSNGRQEDYPILVTSGSAMHSAYSAIAASTFLEFLDLPLNPRPPILPRSKL